MATLKQVGSQLIRHRNNVSIIPLEKIVLYVEVVSMVVDFIVTRQLIVDGKIRKINWWNLNLIIDIVRFFRDIVRKLTDGEEG